MSEAETIGDWDKDYLYLLTYQDSLEFDQEISVEEVNQAWRICDVHYEREEIQQFFERHMLKLCVKSVSFTPYYTNTGELRLIEQSMQLALDILNKLLREGKFQFFICVSRLIDVTMPFFAGYKNEYGYTVQGFKEYKARNVDYVAKLDMYSLFPEIIKHSGFEWTTCNDCAFGCLALRSKTLSRKGY
jgi:hypothetical protein